MTKKFWKVHQEINKCVTAKTQDGKQDRVLKCQALHTAQGGKTAGNPLKVSPHRFCVTLQTVSALSNVWKHCYTMAVAVGMPSLCWL